MRITAERRPAAWSSPGTARERGSWPVVEVLLEVEPFLQPSPTKNIGGDCFACALTAALRWLYPERPVDFETAWGYWNHQQKHGGGETLGNTWFATRTALYAAHSDGYRMEIENDFVQPLWAPEQWDHAWWSSFPTHRYALRLEGWLRGGWVAFANINYGGSGPMAPDGLLYDTDHFILLDGIKTYWKPAESGGATKTHELHVVCSVKGAYWTDLQMFLRLHGAGAWWLARRDRERA